MLTSASLKNQQKKGVIRLNTGAFSRVDAFVYLGSPLIPCF